MQIPKILHYVWAGSSLPSKFQCYVDGWVRLHPDFTLIVWDDKKIDWTIPYLQTARSNGKWSNIANLVRLMALREYGGIYLDTDVEVLKSFESLLGDACFLGFQVRERSFEWINNAVLGAVPRHPFIRKLEQRLLNQFDGLEDANLSSPRLTTSLLLEEYGLIKCRKGDDESVLLQDVRVYPTRYFYPTSPLGQAESEICVDSYAIHHWANSWMAPDDTRRVRA